MFRTALLRSARSATSQAARGSGAIARSASASSLLTKSRFAPSAFEAVRCYSAAAGLAKPEVEGRIVDLLKNFDKVDSATHGILKSLR
jgi:NADH dehydrogenase (ubiquinone) 1 alpha/beta subcomplex 1